MNTNDQKKTGAGNGATASEPATHTPTAGVPPPMPDPPQPQEMKKGKPVLYRDVKTVLTIPSEEFHEKLLCDGIVLNLGDACVFSCTFCYVEGAMLKLDKVVIDAHNREEQKKAGERGEEYTPLSFQDVVIRRRNSLEVLKEQLLDGDGSPKYSAPDDTRVVYSSSLVDVAANMELLRETAAACNLILKHTNWQIRLLSKSPLLKRLVEKEMIPQEYHQRLIFGFSIGTLNDKVAAAIELGTGLVSMRLKALHWLQDNGYRTFGMLCPSLPQKDYNHFSREVCEAIRIEKCEHVWAEVINVRGKSLIKTTAALRKAGFEEEAAQLKAVSGAGHQEAWEKYARATFLAHAKNIPTDKLRFLQYIDAASADWWKDQRDKGAILIGAEAKLQGLLTGGESAPAEPLPALKKADREFRTHREEIVTTGVKASIAAGKALYEIHTHKNGRLWKGDYLSFVNYCESKWGHGKSHAYRLLDTGRFICEVGNSDSPCGEKLPVNEAQIRPLLKIVPKERQAECWMEIVKDKDPADLTGPMVNKEAKKFARKHELAKKKKSAVDAEEATPESPAGETLGLQNPSKNPGCAKGKSPANASKLAGELLGELKAAVSAHPAGKEISLLLKEIQIRLTAPDAEAAAGDQVVAQAISTKVSLVLAEGAPPPASPAKPVGSPTIDVDCEILGSTAVPPLDEPATATPAKAPGHYAIKKWKTMLSEISREVRNANRKDEIFELIEKLRADMDSA